VLDSVSDSTAIDHGRRGDAPAKRDRPRRLLTRVDRRTAAGKRITELKATFLAALEAQGRELTPSLKLKVEQAAQLQAFAEAARGRFLRGESSDRIDGICTAERLAERAVKALRLVDGPAKPAGPSAIERLRSHMEALVRE